VKRKSLSYSVLRHLLTSILSSAKVSWFPQGTSFSSRLPKHSEPPILLVGPRRYKSHGCSLAKPEPSPLSAPGLRSIETAELLTSREGSRPEGAKRSVKSLGVNFSFIGYPYALGAGRFSRASQRVQTPRFLAIAKAGWIIPGFRSYWAWQASSSAARFSNVTDGGSTFEGATT